MYFTFMYLSSLILAMFSGRAIDLLGSKKGMVVGICFMSFLIIIYSMALSFSYLLTLAFIVGIGHSLITLASNKGTINSIFPKRRAVAMELVNPVRLKAFFWLFYVYWLLQLVEIIYYPRCKKFLLRIFTLRYY